LAQVASAYRLPDGNYHQTCYSCRFTPRHVLKCVCQATTGMYRRTAVRVGRRCDFVQNLNGNLTCTSRSRHPVRPRPRPARRGRKVVVNAGPIMSNMDAQGICPRVCRRYRRWDGQWWTLRGRFTSVCECIR
jgi:hypothetical protein